MPQMPKLQGEQECSGHREEPGEGHGNEDLPVQGPTGGHAPGKASDPGLLEIRNAEDVGSNDSHGVRRVHKEPMLAQNHVSILWEKGDSKEELLIKLLNKQTNEHHQQQKLSYMGGYQNFKFSNLKLVPLFILGSKHWTLFLMALHSTLLHQRHPRAKKIEIVFN